MQAYFLATENPQTQASQFPTPQKAVGNQVNASRFSDLMICSHYSMDSSIITAAFSFGYRLDRSLVFRDFEDRRPRYLDMSNYQPWLTIGDDDTVRPLPPGYLVHRNDPFVFGSLPSINSSRFKTMN
jgi:hypothetical protein